MSNQLLYDTVHKFYTSELVYNPDFLPPKNGVNQVYFPTCKYTLNTSKFFGWFLNQTLTSEFIQDVKDVLFNKDKHLLDNFQPQTTQPQEVSMNLNTIFPNFNPESLLNVWWGLPSSVQNQIKKLVPDKDTWTLDLTKDPSGVWIFSLPQFFTFNESLCNGTEKVIDYWFEKVSGYQSVNHSKIKMTVSSVPTTDFNTSLTWMYEDPSWEGSNFYFDVGSSMDVWLCPYVQVLFKGVPQTLYVTFSDPV